MTRLQLRHTLEWLAHHLFVAFIATIISLVTWLFAWAMYDSYLDQDWGRLFVCSLIPAIVTFAIGVPGFLELQHHFECWVNAEPDAKLISLNRKPIELEAGQLSLDTDDQGHLSIAE